MLLSASRGIVKLRSHGAVRKARQRGPSTARLPYDPRPRCRNTEASPLDAWIFGTLFENDAQLSTDQKRGKTPLSAFLSPPARGLNRGLCHELRVFAPRSRNRRDEELADAVPKQLWARRICGEGLDAS
jgi:hypothetical protein